MAFLSSETMANSSAATLSMRVLIHRHGFRLCKCQYGLTEQKIFKISTFDLKTEAFHLFQFLRVKAWLCYCLGGNSRPDYYMYHSVN